MTSAANSAHCTGRSMLMPVDAEATFGVALKMRASNGCQESFTLECVSAAHDVLMSSVQPRRVIRVMLCHERCDIAKTGSFSAGSRGTKQRLAVAEEQRERRDPGHSGGAGGLAPGQQQLRVHRRLHVLRDGQLRLR